MFQKSQLTPGELFSLVGSLSVQGSLSIRAWEHPDRVLFTFLNDEGVENNKYTYLELWQRAHSIADYLSSQTEYSDRVMLFYPQGLDFIAAFFACLISGRIAVPINLPTRRRAGRCVNIINDSGAKVALAPQSILYKTADCFVDTDASHLQWIATDTIPVIKSKPDLSDIQSRTNLDDIAFLQYTSGSTSNPKGVMVTHRNLAINLRLMRDMWELNESSTMVFWQPHHHDMGLIMGQLLPIVLGSHSILMAPNTAVRQPSIWLKAISDYKAVFAGGPNFIYELAVERYFPKKFEGVDLSSWEVAPNGADVVRPTTLEKFHSVYKEYGFRMDTFLPCYGLAEATLVVTGGPTRSKPKEMTVDVEALEHKRKVVEPSQNESSRVLVGCGEPSWEFEVAIVDPETKEKCDTNEVGEIWLHGPSVTAGYWLNEEATVQSFHGNIEGEHNKSYLRTGDVGFIGKDDKHLYICGRLKDLIICEGRNLHPEDIEYTIIEATSTLKPQSCAVFSYEKDNERQAIVAIIETDRNLKRSLAEKGREIRTKIGESVADEHGIGLRKIIFIPPATLKKTTSGKVQRSLIKRLYLNGELEVLQ